MTTSAWLTLSLLLTLQAPPPPSPTAPPQPTIGPAQPKRPSEQIPPAKPKADAPDAESKAWVQDINRRIAKALKTVKSTECQFYKQEWKKQDIKPSRAILKHRTRGDVFLDFKEGPNKGRQILYRPGKNNGKLLVSNPLMNISLDPEGFLATRYNRHTIKRAGLLNTAETIVRDSKKVRKLGPGVATYEKLGRRKVGGDWSRCYRSTLDKKKYPQLFAMKTEVCVSERTGLPSEVKVWQHEGGRLRRVGLYRYSKCKLNTLTDKDFDPDNPAYKF